MDDELAIERRGHVGVVEIRRPPHNFFDTALIAGLAGAFEALEREPHCRAIVLASEGRSFCAGANFQGRDTSRGEIYAELYAAALRLFVCALPVVAAIQGPAVGGGLGLALVADFRVAAPAARFAANFVQLGIHPGFGLTLTLPRLIGTQRAHLMFLTGRRIDADTAHAWRLVDRVVPQEDVRAAALALAGEIAEGAPLAVQSTRATLRRELVAAVRAQVAHEHAEQTRLFATRDHAEGVRAVRERRPGRFVGA